MKLKILTLTGICIWLTSGSCKKEEHNATTEGTPAPVFSIIGTWKKVGNIHTAKGGGMDTTINWMDYMQPCDKDDLTRFNADSTITILRGAIKCGSEDDSAGAGTWRLFDNNTKLFINGHTIPGVEDVLLLNETTLKLQTQKTDNGTVRTDTQTFTRQ